MAVVQSSTMTPLVTPTGRNGSLSIHQDASLFRLQLQAGEHYDLAAQKHVGYLQVISGGALSNEYALTPGDGLGIIKDQLSISAGGEGLVALWFELPQNDSL
jgi:redox-sensitive bicupin YhaK (pirin superfamily)